MKIIVMVDWADDQSGKNEWTCSKEGAARFKRVMKYFEKWRTKQSGDYRLVLWHAHYPGRFTPPSELLADGSMPFDASVNLLEKQIEAVTKNYSSDEPILLADDSIWFGDDFSLEPYIERSKRVGEQIVPANGAMLLSPAAQRAFADLYELFPKTPKNAEKDAPITFDGPDWTEEDFVAWSERTNWTFAKTYAETAPHEYAVRPKSNTSAAELYHATMFILRHGFVQMFYQTPFMSYEVANRRYWSCGGYDLVNRTREGDLKAYK